jgi:hypothetical protein
MFDNSSCGISRHGYVPERNGPEQLSHGVLGSALLQSQPAIFTGRVRRDDMKQCHLRIEALGQIDGVPRRSD